MSLHVEIPVLEFSFAQWGAKSKLSEKVELGRAAMVAVHSRAVDWITNPMTGLLEPVYQEIGRSESLNVITKVGRAFLHLQGYGTTGLGACGFNYIALSNDSLGEDADSTTLSTEIAANGLARAQGAVTLATSSNQTTIDKTFTCITNPQAAQKAALFTAASVGIMNHPLAFTQRSLIVNDTLRITYTITLG